MDSSTIDDFVVSITIGAGDIGINRERKKKSDFMRRMSKYVDICKKFNVKSFLKYLMTSLIGDQRRV